MNQRNSPENQWAREIEEEGKIQRGKRERKERETSISCPSARMSFPLISECVREPIGISMEQERDREKKKRQDKRERERETHLKCSWNDFLQSLILLT